jgi:signal transduction histidine kinase
LDDLGLVPALNAQVRDFEIRSKVEADFVVDGKRRRIRPDLETIVFRIGQEALTNIAKHASADSVHVHLAFRDSSLRLSIEDDGCGFNPEDVLFGNGSGRSAWGLLGIQERVALVGGVCSILSEPGSGTRIEATVPLSEEKDSNG